MKRLTFFLLLPVATLIAGLGTASAQVTEFADPNVDYGFEIPDAKWKMTVKPSAMVPNVEYVFVDRNDGHLEVRRLTVLPGALMSDIVKAEENKLQFLPGYVAGKEEVFRGHLNGTVFNFEFVRSGRPMSGRFYFLRASDNTVYLLRFTGFTDKLRSIRNQTDAIGRTFQIKKAA